MSSAVGKAESAVGSEGAPVDARSAAGRRDQGRRPDGPNAGILAIVILVLSLAGVIVPAAIAGAFYPSPDETTRAIASYLTLHREAVALTGFFAFAASVPLGIYAATVYARLLKLGVRVPGPNIALFGGISASVLLAASGLVTWSLGQPVSGESPAVLHLLAYVVYAFGGVGFVGGIGLLIAGVSVPSLILGLTPRWLAIVGLVLAAVAELSFLALLLPQLSFLLPIGRFAGSAWLIAAGLLLPRNRHEVSR
jgi:hypothetical protein